MNHQDAPSAQQLALQLKADIVLLVDLVMSHSRAVELVSHEDLQREFISRAPGNKPMTPDQAQADIRAIPVQVKLLSGSADDSPEGKERRRLLSRREMLHSLFSGDLSVRDLKTEESEQREITPEYFETVLRETLSGNNGVESLVSWENKRFYHFSPLLSASYARLLSAQNNPYELVLNTVRECSRLYPKPVGVFTFEFAPFNLKPEVIQNILDRFSEDPKTKDIRVSVTTTGSVYLYSSDYLEDDYADFLAEEMDSGEAEML